MEDHDVFWQLGALSDRQVLERVGSMLGSSRRLMAELVAHLGEVEERRLHLAAACSSMFAYCLKLGMTEDEAYRRIEVARLARRYPAIFPLLAAGQLTISTVALLKHHLSEENHIELLAALRGKSVVETRALIAARFPRPDVPSSVRKVPERGTTVQPLLATSATFAHSETEPRTGATEPRTEMPMRFAPAGKAAPDPERPAPCGAPAQRATSPRGSARIEPLSAARYKVQFTGSAELARKLELARDLMRHSLPGGELGSVVEQALDLLIESLMRRRFGNTKRASPKRTNERARRGVPEQRNDVGSDRLGTRDTAKPSTAAFADAMAHGVGTLDTVAPDTAVPPTTVTLDTAAVERDRGAEPKHDALSSYIARSTRRIVVERDGLCCSWVDESGVRCGSRGWLEYDHHQPRAKGGSAEADNLRLLCRSHNRFAAEREFGRRHVEETIARRRRERTRHAI